MVSLFNICFEKSTYNIYNFDSNWYIMGSYFSINEKILEWVMSDNKQTIKHLQISKDKGIVIDLPNES